MSQVSVDLPMLSVSGGGSSTYTPTNFMYTVPNYAPGNFLGMVNTSVGINTGLAMDTNIGDIVNTYGTGRALGILHSFSYMDRLSLERNWTPESTYFNSFLLAGQNQFPSGQWSTPSLSGSVFSSAKALSHYIAGSGSGLAVAIDRVGLNVRPQDVPALKRILDTEINPGTYFFSDPRFGYQTYKDSVVTGSYLGGIVLAAEGSVTINPDRSYTYNFTVNAAKPDLYDADAKPTGARPWYAEWSTAILNTFGGVPYEINMLGTQNFSGSGVLRTRGSFNELITGDGLDNQLATAQNNQTLAGGIGNDSYLVYTSDTIIFEAAGEGTDRVVSAVDISLPANFENLYLSGYSVVGNGNDLENHILGNEIDNYLSGGEGRDLIDGDGGFDTAHYYYGLRDVTAVTYNGNTVLLTANEGNDRLQNIERVSAPGISMFLRDNLMQYVASHEDLINHFGSRPSPTAVLDNFEAYNSFGNRDIWFHGADYLVSNRDVFAAYGFNPEEAARHYIDFGRAEGRGISFNGLSYVASYGDLIGAFGSDRDAGAKHFIDSGGAEGRQVIFNPFSYMQRNPDVAAAYGSDADLVTLHYITSGFQEGRVWQ